MTPSRRIVAVVSAALAAAAFASAAAGPATGTAKQSRRAAPGAATPPAAPVMPAPDTMGGHATTRVLVRLRAGVEPVRLADGRPSLGRLGDPRPTPESEALAAELARFGATAIVPLFPGRRADIAAAAALGLDRTCAIETPLGTDTPGLVALLAAHGGLVEFAELDGIGGLADAPNDPQFFIQYALANVGQSILGTAGTAGADINALPAFAIAPSAAEVRIAFLDSGLNAHPEFAGRIDPGWNIPQNGPNTADGCSSHGTHVAGIAAAARNNALGIAGIAADARLVPFVVVNPCNGTESLVATALVRAVDEGIRIVNMSLQYYTGSTTLRNAVLYAAGLDAVLVAATGNNGNAAIAFPARWPETIAVGALTHTGAPWSSSNFGPEVDLAAPGFGIQSTVETSSYGTKSGTSMAVPHVTGTVALMRARNPGLSATEIRSILRSTATDVHLPGFDAQTGYGRLDLYAALLATPPVSTPGDLNGDGRVDAADLAAMLGAWGACPECDTCLADLDGDCTVSAPDLAILLGNWS